MSLHPQRDGPTPGFAHAGRSSAPSAPAPTSEALVQARAQDRIRGQIMQVSLKRLLDQVPGARRALPHLAALEDALGRRGACAAEQVPSQWLARIITQLGSLPLRDDDLELQELLSRLCRALAVHQRPRQDLPVLTDAYGAGTSPAARPAQPAALAAQTAPGARPAVAASRPALRPAWAEAPGFYADHPAVRHPPNPAPPVGPQDRGNGDAVQRPKAPATTRPPAAKASRPAAPLDEDGLPRFTTVPKASELELEPEVFQTFFGERLRPFEKTKPLQAMPATPEPEP